MTDVFLRGGFMLEFLLSSPRVLPVTQVIGQIAFTEPGTYDWIVPDNVFSISAVCIAGGGSGAWLNNTGIALGSSGGGGGMVWAADITVTPGEILNVIVGAGGEAKVGPFNSTTSAIAGIVGGNSEIDRVSDQSRIMWATGGGRGGTSSVNPPVTLAGGIGGGGNKGTTTGSTFRGGAAGAAYRDASTPNNYFYSGAGGAAGYTGAGGVGSGHNGTVLVAATAGQGGGGGGTTGAAVTSRRGGGVGLFGLGNNGAAGITTDGGAGSQFPDSGEFGGGGPLAYTDRLVGNIYPGQGGAVRIIWGPNRSYPNNNTGDLFPTE